MKRQEKGPRRVQAFLSEGGRIYRGKWQKKIDVWGGGRGQPKHGKMKMATEPQYNRVEKLPNAGGEVTCEKVAIRKGQRGRFKTGVRPLSGTR